MTVCPPTECRAVVVPTGRASKGSPRPCAAPSGLPTSTTRGVRWTSPAETSVRQSAQPKVSPFFF